MILVSGILTDSIPVTWLNLPLGGSCPCVLPLDGLHSQPEDPEGHAQVRLCRDAQLHVMRSVHPQSGRTVRGQQNGSEPADVSDGHWGPGWPGHKAPSRQVTSPSLLPLTLSVFASSAAAHQDDYMDALAKLHMTVSRAYKANPGIKFEVFIHKVDGLSDDHKIETQRDIHQRANDDLVDVGLESIHLRWGRCCLSLRCTLVYIKCISFASIMFLPGQIPSVVYPVPLMEWGVDW